MEDNIEEGIDENQLSIAIEIATRNPLVIAKCPELPLATDPNAGDESICASCPYRVNAPEYLNCELIVREVGDFTQLEVANMMGIGRSTLAEIEIKAMEKIRKKVARGKFPEIKREQVRNDKQVAKMQDDMKTDMLILEEIVRQYNEGQQK